MVKILAAHDRSNRQIGLHTVTNFSPQAPVPTRLASPDIAEHMIEMVRVLPSAASAVCVKLCLTVGRVGPIGQNERLRMSDYYITRQQYTLPRVGR